MQNSKLLEVIACLERKQLSRFSRFLASPYFNTNEQLRELFDYLKKFHPEFKHQGLVRAILFKKVKWSKKVKPSQLPSFMTQLLNALETFLVIEKIQENKKQFNLSLSAIYNELNLNTPYQGVIRKARENLIENNLKNVEHYRNLEALERLESLFFDKQGRRVYNERLQNSIGHFDRYFILQKLMYSCEALNLQRILNVQYELDFTESIISYIESRDMSAYPAILIYYHNFQMLSHPESTEYYKTFRTLLQQHSLIFPGEERRTLYAYALNYCTRQINKSNAQYFVSEYLQINKALIDEELFIEQGRLSPWRYKNVVTTGLKAGDMAWTLAFIEQFKEALPEEEREPSYYYNLAHYYYYERRYGEARSALALASSKDIFFNLSIRSLLIKIFYEAEEFNLLDAALEAFRVFIRRHDEISPPARARIAQFIEYLRKILNCPTFDKEKRRKLLEDLPESDKILHRDWLCEVLSGG